ncbi:MAG TPA: hypothetical protein VHM19_15910, partial [Polyangiales bacterium]|nr:hypothetical protein [Polyangiales bacterium]
MNYRLGSNLVLAAVLTLAAVACKDDAKHGNGSDGGTQGGMHGDEADAGPAAPVRMARKEDVAALFKPLVDAICANAFSCCNADELAFQYGPGITADNCSAKILDAADQRRYGVPLSAAPELEVINDLARLQYGFDLGRARIDAEAVKACAALIEKRACAKDQPTDHCVARPSDEMDATAQLAAACAADTLVVGLQKMGADCDPDATDCAEALFCRSTGSSRGVCIAKAAAGDACLSDFDCGELVCDYATAKCVEGAGAGQACAYFDSALPNEGSETTRCKQGLLCDTVAFVCSDPVCAGGTSCNDETQCPEGLRCVRYRCGERLAAGVNCYQDDDCKS